MKKSRSKNIESKSRASRLLRYLHALEMLDEEDTKYTTYREVALMAGVKSRVSFGVELNRIGNINIGTRGFGIPVRKMLHALRYSLGIGRYNAVIVGMGVMGLAMASWEPLRAACPIVSLLDCDSGLDEASIGGMPVDNIADLDIPTLVSSRNIQVAVIADLSPKRAKKIVSMLAQQGVRGFWNLSQKPLDFSVEGCFISNGIEGLSGILFSMASEDDQNA